MKILFLDVDGVLNSEDTFFRTKGERESLFVIDPHMALLVARIVEATGCQIVLSSSWRNHPDGVAVVERRVWKILDKTCRSWYDKGNDHHSMRGEEIQKWLDEHPEVTRYCILDDDSDMLPHQKHFKTSWKVGLTAEIADNVIKYFNS